MNFCMVLEILNVEVSTRKRKHEASYDLRVAHDKLRTMCSTFKAPEADQNTIQSAVLQIVYDRLCNDIEMMIRNWHVNTKEARYQTVRAIQVISLLNHDIRTCTSMTPRVAACVFYQLRCQRSDSCNDTLPPYEHVPYALDLSVPLPDTSTVYWDKTGHTDEDKIVAKIARAPPPNPAVYYEKRRLIGNRIIHSNGETRMRYIPGHPKKCKGFSWNDAVNIIVENERLPELENAPGKVHAYVSSIRARLQKDMRRTSKSKRCCVNRDCRREYPCYEWKTNDFHEQILYHLFPKIDRHYARYWLELLKSYSRTSLGAVSFCSTICFEQCWVPCMRNTLGSTHWNLHVDDDNPLDEQKEEKSQRVHAVLKCLIDRNKSMHVDLKHLIERDQRSSTCLRERDVKTIAEMMIYVLNMDTIIVMMLSTLRSTSTIVNDPCPHGWRAKFSVEELRHYTDGALFLLNLRPCWMPKNSNTSLIYTTQDLNLLHKYSLQHIGKNAGLYVKLRQTGN